MIVADSSYVVEGVLTDESLLRREAILVPDLAIYETISAIWKHQIILGRLSDGRGYISVLFELIRANKLLAVGPDEEILSMAYDISLRHHSHPYDAVFVAMAVITGLELKTFDTKQRKEFEQERDKGGPPDSDSISWGKRRGPKRGT